MPSWRTHRRIYEKLLKEEEGFVIWTPDLLEKIDRIIDAGGEHDVGRPPDPMSFRRLLRELWLEFGDVYDVRAGRFLGLKTRAERLAWERTIIAKYGIDTKDFLLYIPDDAIVLALLHHILDLCMYFLRLYPIEENEASQMINYVEQVFKQPGYLMELQDLISMTGRPFSDIFSWLINIIRKRANQIYRILVEELRSKGLEPGYSPEFLLYLLSV